jgi:hypothetical protein
MFNSDHTVTGEMVVGVSERPNTGHKHTILQSKHSRRLKAQTILHSVWTSVRNRRRTEMAVASLCKLNRHLSRETVD